MTRLFRIGTLTALLLALAFVPSAYAQQGASYGLPLNGIDTVTMSAEAVNTNTPLVIRYVGATALGGTVTVAAGGDITLSEGAVGASAVDTTAGCPAAGTGIIDVSDPACDTFGEVVNNINGTGTNWRVVLLDGLASQSSNNTLAALAETAANTTSGLGLYADQAISFTYTYAIQSTRTLDWFMQGGSASIFNPDPYGDGRPVIYFLSSTCTYGAGTSRMKVYAVDYVMSGTTYSETVTTLYNTASAATTVTKEVPWAYGLLADRGTKLVISIENSAAYSVPSIYAYGQYLTQ